MEFVCCFCSHGNLRFLLESNHITEFVCQEEEFPNSITMEMVTTMLISKLLHQSKLGIV